MIRAKRIFLDTGLLMLFVVGATDKKLIAKHRRLKEFQEQDYDTLIDKIGHVDKVLVTPNTLTEASNLLDHHGEPERTRIFETLRIFIEEQKEIVVASKAASQRKEFIRLGLTDAGLLEVISNSNPLITVDLALYLAATRRERGAAYNFRYYQSWA